MERWHALQRETHTALLQQGDGEDEKAWLLSRASYGDKSMQTDSHGGGRQSGRRSFFQSVLFRGVS